MATPRLRDDPLLQPYYEDAKWETNFEEIDDGTDIGQLLNQRILAKTKHEDLHEFIQKNERKAGLRGNRNRHRYTVTVTRKARYVKQLANHQRAMDMIDLRIAQLELELDQQQSYFAVRFMFLVLCVVPFCCCP